MKLLANIIGAGNLGKTIGYLLVKHKLVTIASICNRSKISAINAIKFIGQGEYCPEISQLPPADLTFITTPDDMISAVCKELSKNSFIKKGSIIIHCSGSLSSDALLLMKARGCFIASVHPMMSFAKPELSIDQYNGTYCAIEGDEEALLSICNLFNAIGSITYKISKKNKTLYHAAGVFASNYLVTLVQHAQTSMIAAGVNNEAAIDIIINIMRGTIANIEQTRSPKESLTGPIKRADVTTIMKHLESLTNIEQKCLYSVLGKATLSLTNHDKETREKIYTALSIPDSES